MTTYRHTEFSLLNLVLLALPIVVCFMVFLISNAPWGYQLITLGLAALFGGLGICFHSLTIEVDDKDVRIFFGKGFLKRRWALADCVGARQVKTRLIDGWGIKLTPDGWLYSVSMPEAVLIRFRNGKAVQLGSDEPEALLAALLEAGLEPEEPA